jgi:hypothetical protein
MPFYVIRRTSPQMSPPLVEYVSKHGIWDQNFKKARVFTSMGAVKNSISHWRGTGDEDAEIVEMELQPTGLSIAVGVAMAPLKERWRRAVQERKDREAKEQRERELAELAWLKSKYPEEE